MFCNRCYNSFQISPWYGCIGIDSHTAECFCAYLPENRSLVCDLRAILAYRGSRNFPKVLLSSPKMGRWARFPPQSAPIVPEDGTIDAPGAGCAAGGQTKKGSTANGLPFSDCRVKQVMLPCVNHDAGLCGRRHGGHRHDAHGARRHALSWLLLMQTRLRWG